VLGGGGARGALQAGALRALVEADLHPDLLVGTSVGALNAAFLAVHGITLDTINALDEVWREAAQADLLPANYLWLTVRILFNRPDEYPASRLRNFFIAHGLSPEMRFGQIRDISLYIVAADLNAIQPVLYGRDPNQSVLEALLASTALPPWVRPIESQGRLLIDGGVVSNLPIEPALSLGATEILALDLADPRDTPPISATNRFGPFLGRLLNTVERRQSELELALAQARRVLLHRIVLQPDRPVQIWDFSRTEELLTKGYELARREIDTWKRETLRRWQRRKTGR